MVSGQLREKYMADNAQDIINDKGMEAIKEVEKAQVQEQVD